MHLRGAIIASLMYIQYGVSGVRTREMISLCVMLAVVSQLLGRDRGAKEVCKRV